MIIIDYSVVDSGQCRLSRTIDAGRVVDSHGDLFASNGYQSGHVSVRVVDGKISLGHYFILADGRRGLIIAIEFQRTCQCRFGLAAHKSVIGHGIGRHGVAVCHVFGFGGHGQTFLCYRQVTVHISDSVVVGRISGGDNIVVAREEHRRITTREHQRATERRLVLSIDESFIGLGIFGSRIAIGHALVLCGDGQCLLGDSQRAVYEYNIVIIGSISADNDSVVVDVRFMIVDTDERQRAAESRFVLVIDESGVTCGISGRRVSIGHRFVISSYSQVLFLNGDSAVDKRNFIVAGSISSDKDIINTDVAVIGVLAVQRQYSAQNGFVLAVDESYIILGIRGYLIAIRHQLVVCGHSQIFLGHCVGVGLIYKGNVIVIIYPSTHYIVVSHRGGRHNFTCERVDAGVTLNNTVINGGQYDLLLTIDAGLGVNCYVDGLGDHRVVILSGIIIVIVICVVRIGTRNIIAIRDRYAHRITTCIFEFIFALYDTNGQPLLRSEIFKIIIIRSYSLNGTIINVRTGVPHYIYSIRSDIVNLCGIFNGIVLADNTQNAGSCSILTCIFGDSVSSQFYLQRIQYAIFVLRQILIGDFDVYNLRINRIVVYKGIFLFYVGIFVIPFQFKFVLHDLERLSFIGQCVIGISDFRARSVITYVHAGIAGRIGDAQTKRIISLYLRNSRRRHLQTRVVRQCGIFPRNSQLFFVDFKCMGRR